MKWIGTLKRMCKKPIRDGTTTETTNLEATTPKKKRQRVAWQWMLVSFLLTLLSVAHIFEIPFMVFDPVKTNVTLQCKINNGNSFVTLDFNSNVTENVNNNGTLDVNSNVTVYVNENGTVNVNNNGTVDVHSNGTVGVNSTVAAEKNVWETSHVVVNATKGPAKPSIMNRIMKDDIGYLNEEGDNVPFEGVNRMKFTFLSGLTVGGFLMGSLVDIIGRAATFKLAARVLIIFGVFTSICRHPVLVGICWFCVGISCAIIYFMTLVNLMEKFAEINEKGQPSEDTANRKDRWTKYKYRLYLCIGFTCVWNFSRLYSLLVAWTTKDWTLICVWLTMIFSIVYFIFGDFFTDNYDTEDDNTDLEKKDDEAKPAGEEIDSDHFFVAIRKRPILALNVFILAFNWFVCCHNLYGLVLGFKKISSNGNMFDNLGIASGFSFIALPIKFGVCIAARRKVLPYGLLQLFSGVAILVMVAFPNVGAGCPTSTSFTSGKIFCAHVANVLISASLGILSSLTIESVPDKYRMHAFGACVVFGRFGTMLGIVISDLGYFNKIAGPAISGILSIVAAIFSRLLPDLTLSRLPKFQQEIERQQFPNRPQAAPEASAPAANSIPLNESS